MKRLHVALIYNGYRDETPEAPEDRASTADLLQMIRMMARTMRRLGHTVTILPLVNDVFAFQRRLRRLNPDVVFNQYEDFAHGGIYDTLVVALVRMMGYPLTGAPALALGLSHYKFTVASLLAGAGIPIPPNTVLLETLGAVNQHKWHFPLIVQASMEHAGIGLGRDSIVHSKKALRAQVRHVLQTYKQPALVQRFLPGREFNVGIVGGKRMRVMPLAEVIYAELPEGVPPIMSYAAKWLENSVEYQKTWINCPAEVEPELAARIGAVALDAFRAVGGWGYGRVDVRLDEAGEPRVLDINCNCCLDDGMGLARSAETAGIEYPQLLQLVLQAALEPCPWSGDVPKPPPRNSRPRPAASAPGVSP
jgi:D-alanine-D-alanine ligase